MMSMRWSLALILLAGSCVSKKMPTDTGEKRAATAPGPAAPTGSGATAPREAGTDRKGDAGAAARPQTEVRKNEDGTWIVIWPDGTMRTTKDGELVVTVPGKGSSTIPSSMKHTPGLEDRMAERPAPDLDECRRLLAEEIETNPRPRAAGGAPEPRPSDTPEDLSSTLKVARDTNEPLRQRHRAMNKLRRHRMLQALPDLRMIALDPDEDLVLRFDAIQAMSQMGNDEDMRTLRTLREQLSVQGPARADEGRAKMLLSAVERAVSVLSNRLDENPGDTR